MKHRKPVKKRNKKTIFQKFFVKSFIEKIEEKIGQRVLGLIAMAIVSYAINFITNHFHSKNLEELKSQVDTLSSLLDYFR